MTKEKCNKKNSKKLEQHGIDKAKARTEVR